jgi:tetratricopeptide (TPR) repeat protein/CHAT domain-containing protein
MSQELNLDFKNSQQVTIQLVQHSSVTVDFAIPLIPQDREAIRHYLEVYAAQYVMDIDDQEAKRVTAQLPQWGKSLFDAVFNNAATKQLFSQFINTPNDKYLLTITTQQPEILSLPWELLHDAGQFLFACQPSITILRRIPAKTTFPVYKTQSQLHILFLISRPQGESFINPRTDAQAVLKAIENYPAISVEFLQPATLENLWQRLQNPELPRVDVIHFDGHGVFDKTTELERKSIEQLNSFPRNLRKQLRNLKIGANTGYLLFEKAGKSGKNGRDKFYVPTSWLSHILSESKIRLMVLSACQSAMVAHDDEETEDEPIGSIAVGLVATSVPSVLAMSYSVMVRATELLFGGFYREIAAGNSVGMALDKARHALLQQRKRRDLQRGQERVEIEVSDWFLPTLYQANEDTVLVSRMTQELPKPHKHNLSALPDAGFWGRRRELWQIENWFVDGIRRVVVSGFSGQGKTFLAQELGRWLLQKANFDAVVFVDYSGYQGQDAVQWAVTTLGSVLEQSLVDVAAANAVLQTNRILLILDNLEVYVTEKPDTLQDLLTVANEWSSLGETRVLITTRPVELGHEAYQKDSENFRQLVLEGLDKEDALHYFEQLLVLSDNPVRLQRDELLRWFVKVQFHPLSIGLLARSLKTEDLANLEARLNQLMLELPDNPVEATLQLVIEQLDDESRRLLPRLGVFQGGAMEDVLLDITEIPAEEWGKLRLALISTGLMRAKNVYEQTYLQFHPSLTTALHSDKQEDLRYRHQRRYYELSDELYFEDEKDPEAIRAIVKCELPNLLFAVKGALAINLNYVAEFVNNVNSFLNIFGLRQDSKIFIQQVTSLLRNVYNDDWYINQISIGEQFFYEGECVQAIDMFTKILKILEGTTNYYHCLTLNWLGRCFRLQGQAKQAIIYYQQSLKIIQQFEQTQDIQHQTGILYSDLADALTDSGHYLKAKTAYKQSLKILQKTDDIIGQIVIQGELGYLALEQRNLNEAEQRYKIVLSIAQRLHDHYHEAIYWHQLSIVYQEGKLWENAEQACRKAIKMHETQGNLFSAAGGWNQLGIIAEEMGKWIEAELWYRKAIEIGTIIGDKKELSAWLSNLANILKNNSTNLTDARKFAEESLDIKKNLDLETTEIWKTYNILAEIADKQCNTKAAKKYRCFSRETKANFGGTLDELKHKHKKLIFAVTWNKNIEEALKDYVEEDYSDENWENIKIAIQQILAGERDVDKLCEPLTFYDAPIITAILEGITNPESLKWFEDV